MPRPARSSTASRRTDGFAGSAIGAVKRDTSAATPTPDRSAA